jgi:hypothetical protein
MKFWFVLVVSFWAWVALASPPKTSAKELSQEARASFDQADKEADPTKADELRRVACDKWEQAFSLSRQADYQLALGLCYRQTNQAKPSESAFRLFLALAPSDHPGRSIAEQALLVIEQEKPAPALVFKEPIPMEETSIQWKRRTLFAIGALGGLGLVAGAITFGALRAQQAPEISGGKGGVVELQP